MKTFWRISTSCILFGIMLILHEWMHFLLAELSPYAYPQDIKLGLVKKDVGYKLGSVPISLLREGDWKFHFAIIVLAPVGIPFLFYKVTHREELLYFLFGSIQDFLLVLLVMGIL